MHLRIVLLAVFVCTTVAFAQVPAGPITADALFQERDEPNLAAGESCINIVNTGTNGAPLLGRGFGAAMGNICVNVYAFLPDEQLIPCCACLITPNGVVNLGVNRDLTIKTLTGVVPTSVVVKLVSSLAGNGGTGTSCTNSAATLTAEVPVAGMLAWGTTLHAQGAILVATTETAFSPATLSVAERASIGGWCAPSRATAAATASAFPATPVRWAAPRGYRASPRKSMEDQ